MKLTGAQIIAQVLIEQGVSAVFGYPGGAALNLYDALQEQREKITHYLSAHEQGATHAADGYARASGKTGVVVATSGPGATNTVTGIATAYMDSIPMVVLTANVDMLQLGRDSFQDVYIAGVVQPVSKHSYVVRDVTKLASTLRNAFRIANSGRKGPVLVDVPKNITAERCEFTPGEPVIPAENPIPDEHELQSAAESIRQSERPVICFGGGVISANAWAELSEFARKANIPVCHTIMGTGGADVPEALELGMVGMHGSPASNRAIDASDLLIAIGTRFSDRVAMNANQFAPKAKIIQIDIDPAEIRKNIDVYSGIVGDVKDVLTSLIPMIEYRERNDWLLRIAQWKAQSEPVTQDGLLHPEQIMRTIGELAGNNLTLVTDVGQHQVWAAQYCKNPGARRFITSGGLGTMGFGYGAAIGAKLACPDQTVVHITGDGSLHMNMTEACTAVSYGFKVITVIMDNGVLGMVKQLQSVFYQGRYYQTQPHRQTDYCTVARGFGLEAFEADSPESFKAVFAQALAGDKAAWIHCRISEEERVLPMIPPGKTVENMIIK